MISGNRDAQAYVWVRATWSLTEFPVGMIIVEKIASRAESIC